MKMQIKNLIQILGLILFCIIISEIDLEKVFSIISGLNLFCFLLANTLFIVLIIIKSLRWNSLMIAQNIKYSLADSTIIYAAAIFVGSITPGNLGDFVKVLYLKEDGYEIGKSFISVLLDRLFDVTSIMVLGIIGFFLLINYSQTSLIIISIALAAIGIIFLYKTSQIKSVISAFFLKVIPERLKSNSFKIFMDFWNGLCATGLKQMIFAAILTIIGWFFYFAAMSILAFSIHINISFLDLVVCISVAHIATLIPISIAGIGTRDVSLIALFSYLGYSSESAIALSMTMLAFYVSNLLICLIAWIIKPVDLSLVHKEV